MGFSLTFTTAPLFLASCACWLCQLGGGGWGKTPKESGDFLWGFYRVAR